MKKILLIGGGEISTYKTLFLDKRAVFLTGKKRPNALFIPTASGESEGYIETFNKVYGKKLGCKTDVLRILKTKPSKQELHKKILSADLIYVGGGNTLRMMRRWRLLGVDRLLKVACTKGVVLTGLSAGGICWFDSGHSDAMSFYHPNKWHYIKVKGVGLIQGIHCPHFDGEQRKKDFLQFMKKYSAMGIAVENECAIEFIDNKYKVIGNKYRNAYRLFRKGKQVVTQKIAKSTKYLSVSEIYKR